MTNESGLRPITMQDVRLAVGEGPLKPADVLAGCNAELARRRALISPVGEVVCSACEGKPVAPNIPCAVCGAAPRGMGWQGMDSAPQGQRILADVRYDPPHRYFGSARVEIGTLDGIGWAGEGIMGEPVAWMPLPAARSALKGESE